MTRLGGAQEIEDLARELGVRGNSPVAGIIAYCRRRVDAWVAEAGCIADIDALESLVIRRLQMVFEEIRTDDDFERLIQVYAKAKKDPVFATMRHKFDDDFGNATYGALIQRRNVGRDAPDRFVAVIDCRGNKLSRRFFTRWHEIAHRLTTHADLFEPVFRSEHDPIEKMMDEIAGQVGFYPPIFEPAFQQAHKGKLLLTFETVQSIVRSAFPSASFQATLFACLRRMTTPALYLEAAPEYNKAVKQQLTTPSLFGHAPPPPELRAVKVVPNEAADEQKFTIPTNMRVPIASVITRLFDCEPITDGDGREDLSQWESRGRCLQTRAVAVEARRVPERVIALVQPVESVPATTPSNSRANLFPTSEGVPN